MKRSRSYRADMAADTLRVGITCYPSVGGSGVLATALGEDLAARGHDVHFIAYERPFRLPSDAPRLHFHPVAINEYELFRFPDYTLPLSVRMAAVSREHRLDILHVHYAMPFAASAYLARQLLLDHQQYAEAEPLLLVAIGLVIALVVCASALLVDATPVQPAVWADRVLVALADLAGEVTETDLIEQVKRAIVYGDTKGD